MRVNPEGGICRFAEASALSSSKRGVVASNREVWATSAGSDVLGET